MALREEEGFELETQLHVAAREGQIEKLQRLILQRADVNKVDVDLYTPLHRACDNKNAACTELLLKAKADPDVSHPGLDGWTPLHVAAWNNSPECTALLMAAGADCTAIDWYGKTPLSLAGKDAKAKMMSNPEAKGDKGDDKWKNLREGCVMKPSAIHLANIERCTKAAEDGGVTGAITVYHGEQQGDFCSDFDKSKGG
eukprot:Skav209057  [mRNA]  locus=scaffold760:146948:147734:- [translate_table: standard]